MGAWGYGHFDNDPASDFMDEVESSDNPGGIFDQAFDAALGSEYVEVDEGSSVIAAAAYIDNHINDTKFSSSGYELPVDSFKTRYLNKDFSYLRLKAIDSLKRILSDKSELYELWAEGEDGGSVWKIGIEEMILRLQK